MTELNRVLIEPWDVNRRLGQLGLTSEVLIKAVESAQAAWSACTENDPPNFPGIASWAAAVRSLREDLGLQQWTRVNDTGQPLIINVDETVAVTCTSSDENTGREGIFDPKTNSAKGPRTIEKVQSNAWLFPELEEDEKAKNDAAQRRRINTWLLLIHRDVVLGQVRSELSRPTRVDSEGHIDGWSERIILPPIDFEPNYEALPDDGSGSDGGDINIEIKRRA